MSKHGTIKRYSLEIEKINRGQYPSFEEIKSYLHELGFEVSKRTIQRDIEQIRYDFGLEICYDRNKNGYFIDYEKSINVESFFRFLEIVNTAELLTESLSESKDALKHISFGSAGQLEGIENLKLFLQAVREKREVSFSHYNFHTEKKLNFTIKPYLLKEYQNRWYVIGIVTNKNEFRTFGIERINNVIIKAKTFKPLKKVELIEMFNKIIGIVYSDKKEEKIVLSFTPTQGKYIKSLPLHESQAVLIDDENECRVSIEVIPNYELTQEILKHGSTVKVIEPRWFVEEIKKELQQTLANYK